MEVLDRPDSDDVFVRARITVWEPPARLCWDSAQDDVVTEVFLVEPLAELLVALVDRGFQPTDERRGDALGNR